MYQAAWKRTVCSFQLFREKSWENLGIGGHVGLTLWRILTWQAKVTQNVNVLLKLNYKYIVYCVVHAVDGCPNNPSDGYSNTWATENNFYGHSVLFPKKTKTGWFNIFTNVITRAFCLHAIFKINFKGFFCRHCRRKTFAWKKPCKMQLPNLTRHHWVYSPTRKINKLYVRCRIIGGEWSRSLFEGWLLWISISF